jgi:hypothetical protein
MAVPWYGRAYRRGVIDMHITDHDERFLLELDPQTYVEMLRRAQVQSAVVYAHSHVGLCYFPSQVGPRHKGLRGRNFFGEVVDRCHQHGIAVVAYCSLIFDTAAYRSHPDWKIIGVDGQPVAERSRYGVCCPNSPYRDYAAALAEEISTQFQVEGLRFDMTFWPTVCYCPHCRRRFAAEVGGELPTVVNWEDPQWVRFQRQREEWLIDFARLMTSTVKRANPQLSVEHQASTYPAGWRLGVTDRLAEQNDFLQGDFYGDAVQGSFVRKLFYNLTPHRPAGFETSVGIDLSNYTVLKSRELLQAKAAAALADGSAFIFIDSIDPVGTLNPAVYERMGSIFTETQAYEAELGGELCQDVGIYLSTESKWDFADNGKRVDDPQLSSRLPHVEAAVSACQSLREHHIPFGVLTRRNLGDLTRHQAIVLPNVLMMGAEEAEAFREFVRAGGRLYASRYTSLLTPDGRKQDDFLLADVYGASYRGETPEKYTYLAPAEGAEPLFEGYTRRHPAGLPAPQILAEACPEAQVLAHLVLPYTDPADPLHFASIHNNPPGRDTGYPALLLHRFGAGRCLYAAGDVESADPHRELFVRLIRLLAGPFSFEVEAPRCVEVTLFHQPDRQRYLIGLVNFQKELPNIPVEGIRVRVRLPHRVPRRLRVLPQGRKQDFAVRGDTVEFQAPRLETLLMLGLDYEA